MVFVLIRGKIIEKFLGVKFALRKHTKNGYNIHDPFVTTLLNCPQLLYALPPLKKLGPNRFLFIKSSPLLANNKHFEWHIVGFYIHVSSTPDKIRK